MDAKYREMRESMSRDIKVNLLKTSKTEEIVKAARGKRKKHYIQRNKDNHDSRIPFAIEKRVEQHLFFSFQYFKF